MGVKTERFLDQEAIEDLLCSICNDVLENPVQCPDEHDFCSNCINKWLVKMTNCPLDHQHLEISQLKPSAKFLRQVLWKLQLKCAFETRGCNVVTNLGEMSKHEVNCEFRSFEVLTDKRVEELEKKVESLNISNKNLTSELEKMRTAMTNSDKNAMAIRKQCEVMHHNSYTISFSRFMRLASAVRSGSRVLIYDISFAFTLPLIAFLWGGSGSVYQWAEAVGDRFNTRGEVEGEMNVVFYRNQDASAIRETMSHRFDVIIVDEKKKWTKEHLKEWLAPCLGTVFEF